MPIDYSIPLQVQPPAPANPLQTLGALYELGAARDQRDAQRYKLDAQRRAYGADSAFRGAMRNRGGNIDLALDDLDAQGFAPEALKFREDLFEQRKKKADVIKVEADARGTRMQQIANIARGANPENALQSKAAILAFAKGDESLYNLADQYLGDPREFDKEKWTRAAEWGRTQADQITADRNAATALNELLTREQTAKRDAHTWEKDRPGILSDYVSKVIAPALGGAQTPEQWDQRTKLIAGFGPLAQEALKAFPAQWSPEAPAQALAMGVSPEKKAELASTAAGQTETARHNRAMEANDTARTGVANEQLGIMRRQLALAEGSPEQQAGLAEMALRDPEILKQLNPTERTRTLKYLAAHGEQFPNKRSDAAKEMIDQTRETVQQLRERMTVMGGGKGAVGAKGPTSLFGLLSNPLPGTPAADFVSYYNTLESRLTLPRMELMRGLGAMSEKEFGTLKASASSLNRNMSDAAFLKELDHIDDALNTMEKRVVISAAPRPDGGGLKPGAGRSETLTPGAPASSGGMVSMKGADGVARDVPANMVAEAERRGMRRVR